MMPALYRTALASAVFTLMTTACTAQETECSTRTLPISVRDAQGIPIRGLQPGDFEAKIHGKPAQILSITPDTRPHRLVILLDTSGSMAANRDSSRWQAASGLALHMAESSGPGLHVGVILFGEKIRVSCDFSVGNAAVVKRLEEMRNDPNFVKDEIRGRTALYDAVATGFRLLGNPTSADVLYVITDGGDNISHLHADDIQRMLEASGVRLFAAILQNSASFRPSTPEELEGPRYVGDLASETGGTTLSLIQFVPGSNRWAIAGQKSPVTLQQAMHHFYQVMLENHLITIQVPAGIRKRQRLQVKLSEESRKKWKDAQVFVPGEIEPCGGAQSH